jgi:hypothetical protein
VSPLVPVLPVLLEWLVLLVWLVSRGPPACRGQG